jgi:hypothetical protein
MAGGEEDREGDRAMRAESEREERGMSEQSVDGVIGRSLPVLDGSADAALRLGHSITIERMRRVSTV